METVTRKMHAGSVGGEVMVVMMTSRVLGHALLQCIQASSLVSDQLSGFVTTSIDFENSICRICRQVETRCGLGQILKDSQIYQLLW